MACPLLHGNKKKETTTETEKLIYYDFRRFRDCRGAIGGKTGKTAVLPGFCKIERGCASLIYGSYLTWARGAPVAPQDCSKK